MEYLYLLPILAVMISQVTSQSLTRNLLAGIDIPDRLKRSRYEDMLDNNILNRLQNNQNWNNLNSLNSILGIRGNSLGNSLDVGDLGNRLAISSNPLLARLGGRVNGLFPPSLNNFGNSLTNSILPGRFNSLNALNSMDDDCIIKCLERNTLSISTQLACGC